MSLYNDVSISETDVDGLLQTFSSRTIRLALWNLAAGWMLTAENRVKLAYWTNVRGRGGTPVLTELCRPVYCNVLHRPMYRVDGSDHG